MSLSSLAVVLFCLAVWLVMVFEFWSLLYFFFVLKIFLVSGNFFIVFFFTLNISLLSFLEPRSRNHI